MFSQVCPPCVSSTFRGGGTPSSWRGEGTPSQVWMGGGLPHPRSGWGVPHPRSGLGVPHPWSGWGGVAPTQVWTGGTLEWMARTGWGTLHHDWMGLPPIRQSSIGSTCYAAGSMPLAFTQEDFLVCENISKKKLRRTFGASKVTFFCTNGQLNITLSGLNTMNHNQSRRKPLSLALQKIYNFIWFCDDFVVALFT